MADKDTETPKPAGDAAPKKISDKKLFLGLGALFVVMVIFYAVSLGPLPTPEVDEAAVEEIEQAYNSDEGAADSSAETSGDETKSVVQGELLFDLAAAKKERILGDPSAPIKISEHASLTCTHCGHFHKETFPAFKTAYIDTGKAYLVYSDFPLNAPALHASMAARCVPEDRYFDFIHDLFQEQDNWAYSKTYMNYLEAKAGEYGLRPAAFRQCVQSEELQTAILERMKAVQAQYNVNSTPSFVVNNQVLISGALPYDQFDQAIKDALSKIEAENTEPSAAPEPADEGE